MPRSSSLCKKLLTATALGLALSAAPAYAAIERHSMSMPTVETNLDALNALRGQAAPGALPDGNRMMWQEGPKGQPAAAAPEPAETGKKTKAKGKKSSRKAEPAALPPVKMQPPPQATPPAPPPPPPPPPPPAPPPPPPAQAAPPPPPPPQAEMSPPPPPPAAPSPPAPLAEPPLMPPPAPESKGEAPATPPSFSAEPKLLGQMSDAAPPAPPPPPAAPASPPSAPAAEVIPPKEAENPGMLGGMKKWLGMDEEAPAPVVAPNMEQETKTATKPPEPAVPPPPPPAAEAPKPESAPPAPAAEAGPTAPPPAAMMGTPQMRFAYNADDTELPSESKGELEKLAQQLKGDPSLRVAIVAHATGSADQPSTARRISLARALAARAYLIDQGVENLRINVQAEGNKAPADQPNRVELFVVSANKG